FDVAGLSSLRASAWRHFSLSAPVIVSQCGERPYLSPGVAGSRVAPELAGSLGVPCALFASSRRHCSFSSPVIVLQRADSPARYDVWAKETPAHPSSIEATIAPNGFAFTLTP